MKKINVLMLGVLVLFSGFFASCKKDTSAAAPEITFDAATNPVTLGTAITTYAITGTIYTAAGLDIVKVFIMDASGGGTQDKSYDSFSSGDVTTTDKMNYVFRFSYTNILSTLRIQIRAIDKNGNETDSEILVINPAANTTSDLNSYPSINLGGSSSAYGSYLDAETGTPYLLSQVNGSATVKSSIDIIFDASTFYNTGGVFSSSTGTKFATTTLSATEFDAISAYSSFSSYSATLNSTSVAVGNVIFFTTTGGKKGLIKIISLTAAATGTAGNGDLKIALKIQK